jgi:hypothetical protein
MEFKLFSAEHTKQRNAVILLMTGLFTYDVWRVFNDRALADWNDLAKSSSNITFVIFPMALTLMAGIGIYRRKPEALAIVSTLILFSVLRFEMILFLYGPSLAFLKPWWSIAIILVVIFLIGVGDLWRSLMFRSPSSRSVTPLWLDKASHNFFLFLLLVSPIVLCIWFGVIAGSPYPVFSVSQDEETIVPPNNFLPLPFGFQVSLPSSAILFAVNPKEGNLSLRAEKNTWTLESINQYDQQVRETFKSSKTPIQSFLEDRYGILPNMIKSTYFGKPDYFFKIKGKDFWGAVSVENLGEKGRAAVQVCLWDDAGAPLGAIKSFCDFTPQDWNWVYSIRRSESPVWSADKYAETAKYCLTKGQKELAGIFLASAVITDSNKPSCLKSLIEFLRKYKTGCQLSAKFQLKEALEDYPQDPILKSIHLTGGAVK